jgi:hypothetical protein
LIRVDAQQVALRVFTSRNRIRPESARGEVAPAT